MKCQAISLIGLGPMGENLTLNIEDKGYQVIVFNRTTSKTEAFINGIAKDKNIIPAYSIRHFIDYLEPPRIIILMVKEGKPVDDFIENLLPLLNRGDLIIDGGNSHFKDTMRRNSYLAENGIFYLGTGISGGEEGALKGPALMPGGQLEAYKLVEKLFRDIAAKTDDGIPCVSYMGPHGAGHFVKMVHNGIEYADMQLIGECIWALRKALNISAVEIADIMFKWNEKDDALRSYLIEIVGYVLKEKDKETDEYLVDRVADITRMKGTGTWTVQSSLELGIPIPTIAAAVFSREMSQDKGLRLKMSKILHLQNVSDEITERNLIDIAHDALYIAKSSSYAQGVALMQAASSEYGFNLNLANIAQVWRSGCIIRAQFLDEIAQAYKENPEIPNLLSAPRFAEAIKSSLPALASFIHAAHSVGVPTLAMDSAYDYILQISSPILFSAQLAAIQRDYFGAHGYFKIESQSNPKILTTDEGKCREFHTQWMSPNHPEEEITK
jgi:6-phosphogluconate dehydrogenase